MSATVIVAYESKAGSKFDLTYYNEKHMPLVLQQWGPYGLKSYTVNQFTAGIGGSPPAIQILATLTWDAPESITKALGSESAAVVFGDVPVFTDIQPTVSIGSQVSAS